MQIPKLKVLAEAGVVREVEVSYATDAEGWTVQITYDSRSGERTEPLERQRGGVRAFATLEAVASGLFACGCESFRVINPQACGEPSNDC